MLDKLKASIDAIYEAGFDRSLWQGALDGFCGAIGANSALTVPRLATEDTLNLPFSKELEEFTTRFVVEGWHQNDYRANRGWPLTDRGQNIVLEQDISTEEFLNREPIYQELLLPFDVKWWAGITFKTPDRQYVLSVVRGPKDDAFSEDDRRLFGVASGHLARAVTIAERIGGVHSSCGLGMLDAVGEAAILLDGQGRIMEMTLAAEAMIGRGLAVVGRTLTATNRESAQRVQAMIARNLAEGPGSAPPLTIERPGQRPLLLDVLPVPCRFDGVFLFARMIVLLTDLQKNDVPTPAVLRQVFDLTPAESRLAIDLALGLSLTESADRHGVTRETAKSHLKAVFAKTETNRQSELIRLINAVARHGRRI